MRILYLHQYFNLPTGPGGTRSFDIATSFLKKGHQVEIITTSSHLKHINLKRGWNLIEEGQLKIHVFKLGYDNQYSYLKRTLIFLIFLLFSTRKVLTIKCDLVIATSTPLTIGIPAMVNKFLRGIPYIFEVRDVWPEAVIAIGAINKKSIRKFLFFLEKVIYKNSAAIIPLSTDMRRSIITRYPELSNHPIEVIENLSEITRFKKYNISQSLLKEKLGFKPRFTVLYAGTFGKVNGLNYVINLAEKIYRLDNSIVFLLIGGGNEKEIIKKNATEKNLLNKNVFILDPLPKDKLPQLYSEIDLGSSFVIPIKELWANSANKFFDTLAAGKPILINHGGWQKQKILKNDIGFVLPPQLDEKNVERFIQYTYEENKLNQQCCNALSTALEEFSLEIAMKKYETIFDRIAPISKRSTKIKNTTLKIKGVPVVRPEKLEKIEEPLG